MTDLGRRAAEAMGAARQLDRLLEVIGQSASPEVQAEVSRLRVRLASNAGELVTLVGTVYSEVYTDDELKALVNFLEGPGGQAMITKQSIVEQKVQELTQAFLERMRTA